MTDEQNQPSGEDAAKQLISLAEAAEISGFSHGHVRLLINRGLLWGTKIGRNWVTTREAIEAYMATDRRPGPKPKEQE